MEGGLVNFGREKISPSLPALKIYLALACWTHKLELDEVPNIFTTFSLKYQDIQRMAGVDRSEILPSLELLEANGLLKFNRGRGTPNVYQLLAKSDKAGWAKVPMMVIDEKKFRDLSLKYSATPVHSRRLVLLDAVKLYTLFLALRDNTINRAKVSYDRMVELTGVSRRGIRPALTVLGNAGMVQQENLGDDIPGPNFYFIKGLAKYRPMRQSQMLKVG